MVYCSPQQRALETAKPIADRFGLEISIPTAALDEVDVGEWTGQFFAARAARSCAGTVEPSPGAVPAPGGESMRDVAERRGCAYRSRCRGHGRSGHVVVVQPCAK